MELDTLTPEMPHIIADMGQQYRPEVLAEELRKRPGGEARAMWRRAGTSGFPVNTKPAGGLRADVSKRAVFVMTKLTGFVAALLRDAATGSLERKMPKRAVQLRTTLAELGPSFIKIGQALSSRPDLVPKVRGAPAHVIPSLGEGRLR